MINSDSGFLDPMVPSELTPLVQGIQGLNPYAMHDSHPRQTMFGGHITQNLVISEPTLRRDFTGLERRYGRHTHSIRMPVNAIIRKIVHKYAQDMSFNEHNINPVISIIYEDAKTGELGILHMKDHNCLHQYFGFKYVLTNKAKSLRVGDYISEGTLLAHSPSIDPVTYDYKYGKEAKLACMTIPNVIEDGCVARRGFLEGMKTRAYETRTFSWGKNSYPINSYGDENNFKAFPGIGDVIREDGLVFASRQNDNLLAIVQANKYNLMEIDSFDDTVYGKAGARVVNVEVFRGKPQNTQTLEGMNAQAEFYYNKTRRYYDEIRNTYREYTRKLGNKPNVSGELERVLVDAEAFYDIGRSGSSIVPQMNDIPINEYHVRITFEYILTPTIGFKITGTAGDKVIIVDIWEDHQMPREVYPDGTYGEVTDLIQDPDGTNRRMNFSRLFQQYFNASQAATTRKIIKMIEPRTEAAYRQAWDYVLGWFDIVTPRYATEVRKLYSNRFVEFIDRIEMEDGYRYWLPVDTNVIYIDAVEQLQKHYPPHYSVVEYVGMSGRTVRTKVPVLIGGIYVMLLEKIGNTQTAVSSAKVQHFGVLAKVSSVDKYSMPGRHSPGRVIGETENRLIAAFCGGHVVAELFDQTNNIAAHKYICETITRADKPTNIDRVIDRKKVPRNGGRILQLAKHVLECQGTRFKRGDFNDAVSSARTTCYM